MRRSTTKPGQTHYVPDLWEASFMSDHRVNALSSAVSSDSSTANPLFDEIRYRRHRIVWDVRPQPGTPYWTGKAAVVALGDGSIQKRIEKVAESPFYTSAEETRRYLIGAAKDWID